MDVAFVEKEAVSNTDMSASTYLSGKQRISSYYWQNKRKDSFSMTKLKDYDGDNNIETLYMKAFEARKYSFYKISWQRFIFMKMSINA